METKRPIVVGLGELLWDMLPDGKRAGRAPINFVYYATQLGADGYAISAVGQDMLGTEIIAELDKNGIRHLLGIIDKPTGTVEVTLKDGIPEYNIIQGVAWDYIPVTEEAIDLVRKADAVCFGTLALRSVTSATTIHVLLDEIREQAIRFFDINLRQDYYTKELINDLLQKANVFKINDDELVLMRDMFALTGDDDTACKQLMQQFGLRYLILTAGSRFSTIYADGEISTIQTPKVTVADTVGAGDSFSGAFVYGILTGKSLKEAHQSAVDTAAYVCTKPGAWPAYLNPESV